MQPQIWVLVWGFFIVPMLIGLGVAAGSARTATTTGPITSLWHETCALARRPPVAEDLTDRAPSAGR